MPARDGGRPPSPRMHPIVRVSARGGAHGSRIDSRNVGRRTAAQPDRPTAQRQPALGVARRRADLLLRAGPEADARRRQDRPLERHDLGAHRARLHARLRHHRADQLRPRRGLHDRLVRVGLDLGHARRDRRDRADPHRRGHHPRVGHRDAVQRDAQHDDRARRVPAAAHRPQARAADHRDRHELHPQNVGLLWRPTPDAAPDLIGSQADYFTIFGVPIEHSDVFAVVVTVPLLVALVWFVGATRYGKAMRATAQDPDAARLMGIDVDRTISLTFMLGGLLAGAAGMIYALYNGTVQFNQGFTAGLIAFTAAVMGGIGNLKGAVVGGLIIGVIQSISDTHYGQVWTLAVVFAILILVMVF